MAEQTQQDQYNRLLAIAFEERVNAQAIAANLQQRLDLAMKVIGELREEAAKTKAPDVTPLAPAETVTMMMD
jgi:hypothetical protein